MEIDKLNEIKEEIEKMDKSSHLEVFNIIESEQIAYNTNMNGIFINLSIVDKSVITWSAQGLFWFLILFSVALFVLFVPVEFLNVYKIYNLTFKDLIINIIFVILTSLITLIFFQFLLNPSK